MLGILHEGKQKQLITAVARKGHSRDDADLVSKKCAARSRKRKDKPNAKDESSIHTDDDNPTTKAGAFPPEKAKRERSPSKARKWHTDDVSELTAESVSIHSGKEERNTQKKVH